MTPLQKKSRRPFEWTKVRDFKTAVAVTIATAGGAGFAPFAPGTAGTIVALPLAWWTSEWDFAPRLAVWILIFMIGTWSAKVFDETMQSQDNQNIVIDEVLGLGISAWTIGKSLPALATAFVLFRLLDSIKPPPIRQIDHWSHRQATAGSPRYAYWWSGFGVMADDVLAGFEALLLVWIAQRLNWLR